MATTKKPLKGAKPAPKTKTVLTKAVAKKAVSAKKAVTVEKKAAVTKKAVPSISKKPTVKSAPSKTNGTPKKPIVVKKSAPLKKAVAKTAPVQTKKPVKKSNTVPVKTVKPTPKKAPAAKATKPTFTVPSKKVAVKPAAKLPVKKTEKKIEKPVKKVPIPVKKETKIVEGKKAAAVPDKKPKVETPAPKLATKPEKPSKPVVIPKTTTDKKVDYEPDFLKSVLDTPVNTPSTPTMRYSDQELQEFRDLINKKLDAAKKELAYLQGLITRKDEMGGDETDNRYMTMEDGGMSMEREQLSQMASRQITFIDHLEKAIMRIENKTYGVCRVTGKLIDKARLRAVPHATLSMEAKLGIVK